MSSDDDESFRPKLGPPKARGRARIPFVSRVLKASARAGHPIGHRVHSPGVRPGAKLGRGHVAARLAGQHLGPRARRVVIKTRLVVAKRSTVRATQRHLRYIQRDGVTREGGSGELYGAARDQVDAKEFEERGQTDRHQFRFIVSPDDAVEIGDLKAFTRQLMAQVERDLGTRLDWIAVDHWDTEHPHTHVVLRGADEEGHDLVIAREYTGALEPSGLDDRGTSFGVIVLQLFCQTASDPYPRRSTPKMARMVLPLKVRALDGDRQ